MSEAEQISDRYASMLARIAEQGLSLATDLHDRALAAESAEEAARLAAAWKGATRSVRQTIALAARLERDLKRAGREDRDDAERAHSRRVEKRKDQVRAAVERLIWTEAEGDEAEPLIDELADRLDEEALYEDFAEGPVDQHIARICGDLGLSPAAHPREGGDAGQGSTAGTGAGLAAASIPASAGVSGVQEGPRGASLRPDHPFQSSA